MAQDKNRCCSYVFVSCRLIWLHAYLRSRSYICTCIHWGHVPNLLFLHRIGSLTRMTIHPTELTPSPSRQERWCPPLYRLFGRRRCSFKAFPQNSDNLLSTATGNGTHMDTPPKKKPHIVQSCLCSSSTVTCNGIYPR